MTYEQIFKQVKKNFEKADTKKIKREFAFQFNITGEGEGIFYAAFKDGVLSVEPYDYKDRDVIFTADGKTFIDISAGKLEPIDAIEHGKLAVDGNDLSNQLMTLIPTVKKPAAKETKPAAKKEAKPTAKKAEAKKPEVKAAPKAEAKPVVKTEAKPAAKAEAKPVVKTEAKPVVKTEAKPAAKTEAKPAAKTEAKPAAKTEAKPAAKTEAKPAVKADTKTDKK